LINGQISGLVNWAINEPINKTNDKLIEKSDGTALKGTGEIQTPYPCRLPLFSLPENTVSPHFYSVAPAKFIQ